MTRKDVTQDIDRPHYYSQFWIDVAQGKRDVTAGRVADAETDVDDIEDEQDHDFEPAPAVASAPVKPKPASKAPEKKPEPARPTITSLADLANIDLLMKSSAEMENDEVPDIESGAIDDLGPLGQQSTVETPAAVPDIDYPEVEDETPESAQEDEDFDDDLDYDEDEEEEGWGGPRKPSKQQKQQQQRRRERRPNF
ncbi:MAG: hypothetical protein ACXWQ5_01240 [Ktedonobacterales bacterium]